MKGKLAVLAPVMNAKPVTKEVLTETSSIKSEAVKYTETPKVERFTVIEDLGDKEVLIDEKGIKWTIGKRMP
jgi:hypothetical protein